MKSFLPIIVTMIFQAEIDDFFALLDQPTRWPTTYPHAYSQASTNQSAIGLLRPEQLAAEYEGGWSKAHLARRALLPADALKRRLNQQASHMAHSEMLLTAWSQSIYEKKYQVLSVHIDHLPLSICC